MLVPNVLVMLLISPAVIRNFVFLHAIGHVDKRLLRGTLQFMQDTFELKK